MATSKENNSRNEMRNGKQPLSITNPDLVREWDFVKNAPLTPDNVIAGSEKKYWWKCSQGHNWEASIAHRAVRGQNCPYCSGRKVLPGYNDLASQNPELAKEWNYEKNLPLTPESITSRSGKKVWWIGRCGHEWYVAPGNRMQGTGCPYCSGQKVLPGYNDLASQKPELAKEWNYEKNTSLTPDMISVGSGRKVWWKCSKRHEWEATVSNRVRGNNCPFCAGKKILPEYNSLASLKPDIAAEWNYEKNAQLLPENVAVASNMKVWWRCSRGHEYQMKISDRTVRNSSCPYCSGHRVLWGFNDLATIKPELIDEWNYEKNSPLTPKDVSVGSQKSVWWKCSKGHEWKTSVAHRTSRGNNCPYCSKRLAFAGESDLQTLYPEIAKEWDNEKNGDLRPQDVRPKSEKKVWWRCVEGHSYNMTIAHRTDRNDGCPYCSGHKVLHGFNDLESRNPELAAEWDNEKNYPLTPQSVTPHSGKKVWWLGKCGHSWEAVISSRTAGADCPYCSDPPKQVLAGFNDLQTKSPQIAAEWHPTKNGSLTPTEVTPMSHKTIWWLGRCGHEWEASVKSRVFGNGCPFCAGRLVLVGFNDLESNYPQLAKEWHPTKNGDLLPSQVTTGSGIKVWWQCLKCGNEWKTDIVSRKNGTGCPFCASERQTSFPEQAVYFYCAQRFDAINRYNDGQYELDVFIPDLMTGIEYDGAFFHEDPSVIIRDKKKQTHFEAKHIRIIRIKESSQNLVDNNLVFFKVDPTYKQLSWAIQQMFTLLNPSALIPDIDLVRDQGKIHEQYILSEKENSFASVYPELISEWNHEKNRIDPSMVSCTSGKNVWWICSVCGHEWNTSIAHRANGRGCPECAKSKRAKAMLKTRLERNGSLQDAFPKIAKEWHPTRNNALKPTEVLAKSSQRVWWKCTNCGYEWRSRIDTRTSQNSGCPECGKQKSVVSRQKLRLVDKGSLMENEPELVKEWHPKKNEGLLPSDVTSGSTRKVWWICSSCGNEWETSIANRVRGRGCPSCAKHIRIETRIKGITDRDGSLQDFDPQIAAEWHPSLNGKLLPTDVTPFSSKKVWWMCNKGHSWEATVAQRTTKGGCPYCSNHRVLPGYNDLLTKNKQLASEWNFEKNIINPSDVTPNSGKKVWWKCSLGHEWQTTIASRASGSGCPYCSGRNVINGVNDLATTNPELIQEWDFKKNENIIPNEAPKSKKVWWVCSVCGYEWNTQIRLRILGYGCPNCARTKSIKARSKSVRCVETGIIYPSTREAANQTGNCQSSIGLCCNGKQKTSGGYHWEFVE